MRAAAGAGAAGAAEAAAATAAAVAAEAAAVTVAVTQAAADRQERMSGVPLTVEDMSPKQSGGALGKGRRTGRERVKTTSQSLREAGQ